MSKTWYVLRNQDGVHVKHCDKEFIDGMLNTGAWTLVNTYQEGLKGGDDSGQRETQGRPGKEGQTEEKKQKEGEINE